MAIPRPEHFFEQARRLIERPGKGAPRQVDIRRAISAAYYGVFHFVLREAADQFIGVANRGSPLYVLAYRGLNHGGLADLCKEARKSTLKPKVERYVPQGEFSKEVKDFCQVFLELKEKRESADYDPSLKFRTGDAALVVESAETAIIRFQSSPAEERRAFLGLLVFPIR